MSGSQENMSGAVADTLLIALDGLATQWMLDGLQGDATSHLRKLGADAEKAGFPKSATAAVQLAANLDQSPAASLPVEIKKGLTELRMMIENESNPEPAPAEPQYSSLSDDAELVGDFLVEAREHLSQIEGQMLALERDPHAMEVVHAVFRAFHTIKGLAGFLGFASIQALSHEVETLLDLARNEKLAVTSQIVDVVLESGDFLLSEMQAIERALNGSAAEAPRDPEALKQKIRALAVAPQPALAGRGASQKSASQPESTKDQGPDEVSSLSTPVAYPESLAPPGEDEVAFFPSGSQTSAEITTTDAIASPSTLPSNSAAVLGVPAKPTEETKIAEAVRPATESVKPPDASSVRVETAKLDHLMDMVGEMVVAQSLIRHSPVLASSNDSRLIGDLSQLARVTAEVQRATMSMRMVPVGHLFQRIERLIRDLSRKAGKQVVLETSGVDTEVDKTVAEELSDPLLHMVRNSVDHGVEPPDERIRVGKDPVARVRLAAYHQGGQVIIAISDDGRGLNAAKIRRKAEEKELIASTVQLSETEVFQLIFEPGFSTADKITDVSGRGVGMDVVRRNVEKLRGRIETQSVLGSGTTFLLKLPLTLAIIDGLVVEAGRNRYIIPLPVVREIFRPHASSLFTVEGRDEMVLVRDQLLPVVRLDQRLGLRGVRRNPQDGLLVVIDSENKSFCLLVDDLVGKQEVVIKALGDLFADVSGLSGCAVLGDGRIGLILDTDGIYRGRRR